MKKKILAICLVAALAATAAISGTLAYFTDNEEATNTFTVGNVDVKLHESQYTMHVDGKTADDIKADAETYLSSYLATEGENIVPGIWVKKAPYVENAGKNPAYVRVVVSVPKAFSDVLEVMTTTTAIEKGVITKAVYGGDDTVDTLTYYYTEPLEPGELAEYPPFWQVRLAPSVENEDVANITAADSIITVSVDAIQSQGFETYTDAFAAFDDQE